MTGADASAQNAYAESPNKYLANMMRCILHAADLGPEYWSFALLHSVYIKNRLPHTFIKMTPYEAITSVKPDLTNLRTFGCRVYVRKPGIKPAKMDNWSSNGIFVGYTSTTKNIYYIDDATNVVKIGVHALFDEAHFTSPRAKQPLAAQTLQVLGYSAFRDKFKNGVFTSKQKLKVTLVHNDAITPKRTSPTSASFDIHTCFTTPIQPGESRNVATGLRFNIPTNHYIEFVSLSPPPMEHCIVMPQVIDSTNVDQIHITVKNTSATILNVMQGTKIAQMLYHKAIIPMIKSKRMTEVEARDTSVCNPQTTTIASTEAVPTAQHDPPIDIVPYDDDEILPNSNETHICKSQNDTGVNAADKDNPIIPLINNMHTDVETPYQIYLSTNPFENVIEVEITTKGDHSTLGLILQTNDTMGNRPQLQACLPSTPAARIPKWRSLLRNSFPTTIDGKRITTEHDVVEAVHQAHSKNKPTITCSFSIIDEVAMHPQQGVPIIYHDQMNIIATHLADIKDSEEEKGARHRKYIEAITPTIALMNSAKKKANGNAFHWQSRGSTER